MLVSAALVGIAAAYYLIPPYINQSSRPDQPTDRINLQLRGRYQEDLVKAAEDCQY